MAASLDRQSGRPLRPPPPHGFSLPVGLCRQFGVNTFTVRNVLLYGNVLRVIINGRIYVKIEDFRRALEHKSSRLLLVSAAHKKGSDSATCQSRRLPRCALAARGTSK